MNDYAMFSDAGNAAVAEALVTLSACAEAGLVTRPALAQTTAEMMEEIARSHAEVDDTAVRECIAAELDRLCDRLGWARLDFYEIT